MDPTVPLPSKEYLQGLQTGSQVIIYHTKRDEAEGPFPVTRSAPSFVELRNMRFYRNTGQTSRGDTLLLEPEKWERIRAERAERAAFYATLTQGMAVLVERIHRGEAASARRAEVGVVAESDWHNTLVVKTLRDNNRHVVNKNGVPRALAYGREVPCQLLPATGPRYEQAMREFYASEIARLGEEKLGALPLATLEAFWKACSSANPQEPAHG